MPERLRERIQARLEALGINPFEAARRAELERSYINDLLIGKKSTMRHAQLLKVAEALDCDPDYLQGLQPVPRMGQMATGSGMTVSGIIEPGVWRERGVGLPSRPIPLGADPRYPADRQKWFIARTDALASLGILDGSVVIAVEGVAVREGEPAVVERHRKSGDVEEVETCIRIREGGAWSAVPSTAIMTNAPTLFSDDEVTVLGLVVLAFRTFGT